jgi:hypothetical protein
MHAHHTFIGPFLLMLVDASANIDIDRFIQVNAKLIEGWNQTSPLSLLSHRAGSHDASMGVLLARLCFITGTHEGVASMGVLLARLPKHRQSVVLPAQAHLPQHHHHHHHHQT